MFMVAGYRDGSTSCNVRAQEITTTTQTANIGLNVPGYQKTANKQVTTGASQNTAQIQITLTCTGGINGNAINYIGAVSLK